jgi:predicted nuclease of predicted toxin-antitoxin system
LKLLFDENLSRKLPAKLKAQFPDSSQVLLCGLETKDDLFICSYALQHGYIIVTRDKDFPLLSATLDPSPKVIWIRRGNASTSDYMRLLMANTEQIEAFANDPQRSVLIIV